MFDKGKNFFLEGNTSFTDRQKNVFGQLDMMSSQKPENRMSEEEVEFQSKKVTVDTSKKEVKHFRGKESIFKKPDKLPQKRSTSLNIPDFVKNPHKWKKYKLDDDESSDQSNRNVAMAFLKEMQDRKAEMEVDEPKNEKIKFNKNFKNDGKETARIDEDDKPSFVNGKLTMPEYVIGQKIKKPKKDEKRKVIAGSSKVKLDHLDEEDDID